MGNTKAMAKKLDRTAYQGDSASGWTGLRAQSGIGTVAFVAGNLDSFKDAQGTVLGAGGLSMVTVVGSTAWTSLSKLHAAHWRVQRRLGDPRPGHSHLHERPCWTTTAPYDPKCVAICWREEAQIVTYEHERFSADQIVAKCTLRAASGVPDDNGVVKMTGLPFPTPPGP